MIGCSINWPKIRGSYIPQSHLMIPGRQKRPDYCHHLSMYYDTATHDEAALQGAGPVIQSSLKSPNIITSTGLSHKEATSSSEHSTRLGQPAHMTTRVINWRMGIQLPSETWTIPISITSSEVIWPCPSIQLKGCWTGRRSQS